MPVKPLYADALSAGSYAAIIVDGSGLIYRNDGQAAEAVNTANGALYQVGKAAADAIGNWSSAVPADLPASVLDYRVLLFSVAGSNLNLTTDGLPVREGSLSWMGNAVGEATIQRANNQGQTTTLPVAASGTGAFARTILVTSDGTTPIASANVRLATNTQAFTGTTGVLGTAVFSLDAGTYTLSITAAGYTYAPTSQVVMASGTTTVTLVVNDTSTSSRFGDD